MNKRDKMKDLTKVRRRKILIQELVSTENAMGDKIESWSNWKELWAEKTNLFGNEYYAAMAVNEEHTVIFTVKHVSFLDQLNAAQHRIIYEGKIFDVKNIDYLKDDGMWVKIKALRRDNIILGPKHEILIK